MDASTAWPQLTGAARGMGVCAECGTNRTESWELVCEPCTEHVDAERPILRLGPALLRYRIAKCLGVLSAVALAYLALYFVVAPALGYAFSHSGGDLRNALALTVSFLIVAIFAGFAAAAACIVFRELRGEEGSRFLVTNLKVKVSVTFRATHFGLATSNRETDLHEIESIHVSQSLLGRLLNYGHARLKLGPSSRGLIELEGIADPFRIKGRVQRLIGDSPKKAGIVSAAHRVSGSPATLEESASIEPFTLSAGRISRYALAMIAALVLLTYCSLNTTYWNESLQPGELRDIQMWTNSIVLPAGGLVQELSWQKTDFDEIKVDVSVLKAEKEELLKTLELEVAPIGVSLESLGPGQSLKVYFTLSLRAAPGAAQGEVAYIVLFRHPKFAYPPVVGGTPHARIRLRLTGGGAGGRRSYYEKVA